VSIGAVEVSRHTAVNQAAALFGESASRVIVSTRADDASRVLERAEAAGVRATVIGRTGGNRLRIAVAGQAAIDVAVDDAERAWSSALERHFVRRVA